MGHDPPAITLSPHATIAIMDAVKRTIVDKGASRATRKAAVSALLALVDAGVMKESVIFTNPLAKGEATVADVHISKKCLLADYQVQPLDARPTAQRSTLAALSEDDGFGIEGERR
jgi:hypothetical protein